MYTRHAGEGRYPFYFSQVHLLPFQLLNSRRKAASSESCTKSRILAAPSASYIIQNVFPIN